jgi:hypothetical protein
MQLQQLRRDILESHQNGVSYQRLAYKYHISKPMVRLIEKGYKPGKRTATILGLEPDAKLLDTRARNAARDAISRIWGYRSASEFWTCMIELYGGESLLIGKDDK